MSKEQVRAFYEHITENETLKASLTERLQLHKKDMGADGNYRRLIEEEVIPVASKLGFCFTVEELEEYGRGASGSAAFEELDLSELDAVVGGSSANMECHVIGVGEGDLAGKGFCFFVGYVDHGGTLYQICSISGLERWN